MLPKYVSVAILQIAKMKVVIQYGLQSRGYVYHNTFGIPRKSVNTVGSYCIMPYLSWGIYQRCSCFNIATQET